jgi:hypothetical protein
VTCVVVGDPAECEHVAEPAGIGGVELALPVVRGAITTVPGPLTRAMSSSEKLS